MNTVAVLAFDDVVAFDLSLACETFGYAQKPDGSGAYEVIVCSERKRSRSRFFSIASDFPLESALDVDTIVVPGVTDIFAPISPTLTSLLNRAYQRGIRIASVCSGAFVLAESGVLDGLRATTHWLATSELQSRYPNIDVDPEVLFVDNGQVLTSAGAASGLDLCLYMIRKDYGAAVAAKTARMVVVQMERAGGQSQFVEHEIPSVEGSLSAVVAWLEKNYRKPLCVADLASQARMSERTLTRKFQEQLGMSPMQFLISIRIRKSQELLETKPLSIDEIAERVGFGSDLTFRDHFKRRVGVSPRVYRSSFTAKTR